MPQKTGAEDLNFPSNTNAIIFDVDGTLYDQRRLRTRLIPKLLFEATIRPAKGIRELRFLAEYRRAQEHLRREIPGTVAKRQFEHALSKTKLSHPAAASCLEKWFDREPLRILAKIADPNIHQILREAKAKGLRLGVFSDYPARKKLEALGLDTAFDIVVSSSDAEIDRLKPDPRGLVAALTALRVPAQTAIYVGDRLDVDAPCAQLAGVHPVIIDPRAGSQLGAHRARISRRQTGDELASSSGGAPTRDRCARSSGVTVVPNTSALLSLLKQKGIIGTNHG